MKLTTDILGALRTAVLSILICCISYTMVIWVIAQVFVPNTANGALVQNAAGQYVGSRQVAQAFTQDKYFHSRPSAAGYNGGGSRRQQSVSDIAGTHRTGTEDHSKIRCFGNKSDSGRYGYGFRKRTGSAYHIESRQISSKPGCPGPRHERRRINENRRISTGISGGDYPEGTDCECTDAKSCA